MTLSWKFINQFSSFCTFDRSISDFRILSNIIYNDKVIDLLLCEKRLFACLQVVRWKLETIVRMLSGVKLFAKIISLLNSNQLNKQFLR